MIKKITWLFISVFFLPLTLLSQGETSNWYFGNNAGIRFNNNGSVITLNDGQLNTFEGCATISNSDGDLLFYTDGIKVYDRNHNLMQNGDDLHGDPSSTQSALIVPKPGDPEIFYIFTVDTSVYEDDPDYGLNYSTVDISLNNGDGAVTQKNRNLLANCSEKVAAVVKDCSDQSIWIVTLASQYGNLDTFDTFHAFEVNTNGVVNSAVKSTFPNLDIEDPRGYLKFSNDGKKAASASMTAGLHLFDFDSVNGIFSNLIHLGINGGNNISYGLEFSPNNKYLYTHSSNNGGQNVSNSSSLIQYDLSTTNISDSQEILHQESIFRGALQLGPNGKIYRTIALNYNTGTPYLGVIHNPNNAGMAANYQHNAINLGNNATQGLPPFIQSFFNTTELILNDSGETTSSLIVCEGSPFRLEAELISGAIYNWKKDGNAFINPDNHFLQINNAQEIDSGRYSLQIISPNPIECPINGLANINVQKIPESTPLTLIQCDLDNILADGYTMFNLEQVNSKSRHSYFFYETEADRIANNPIQEPSNYRNTTAFNQTLFYTVQTEGNCSNEGELELVVNNNAIIKDPNNTIYSCNLDPSSSQVVGTFDLIGFKNNYFPSTALSFYNTLEDAAFEQNILGQSITSENNTIYGRTESIDGCQDIIEIQLVVYPKPVIELDDEFQVCTDNPDLVVNGPEGFDSYEWFKIDGNDIISITSAPNVSIISAGIYKLEVGYEYNNNGTITTCLNSKEFEVFPSNKAVINDISILDFSENNSITIDVSGDGDYEYSIDGIEFYDSNTFNSVDPGFTIVHVRDKKGCGTVKKEIAVLGYLKFFTPNGDGYNDNWGLIGLNPSDHANSSISIYDRYGKKVAEIDADNNSWNGTYNSQPLPSSDYWFKASLHDGRTYKGHFALKR